MKCTVCRKAFCNDAFFYLNKQALDIVFPPASGGQSTATTEKSVREKLNELRAQKRVFLVDTGREDGDGHIAVLCESNAKIDGDAKKAGSECISNSQKHGKEDW